MDQLSLHVGFPKNGSSAIPVALRENDKFLEQYGIKYPLLDEQAIKCKGFGSCDAVFFVEAL